MAKKEIYLIDMDGVLADVVDGFNLQLNTLFPLVTPLPYEQITSFFIETCYPKEYQKELEGIWAKEGLFAGLKPIDGAFEALDYLLSKGKEFRVCTAPNLESKTCEGEKKEWLRKYGGDEYVKRLIITPDKTLIIGDYLIDDKSKVTGLIEKPVWEHILYSQPWNAQETGKRRITWDNYKDILEI